MKWIAAALTLLALPLAASDQSMGEAARKARERREKNAKEGVRAKSYTQDDVAKAPPLANDPNQPPAASGSAPAAASSSGTGSSSPGGATVGGQSETVWRSRIADARRRALSTRKDYEYWNGYTMVPGEILVDEKDRPIVTSVEQLQARTAAAKKALDGADKALVNLEEEARRAGVPPGWLR